MNVYDFDGTLYDGDCMVDLYKYCLKRRPYILVVFPSQFRAWYRFRKGSNVPILSCVKALQP